MSQKVVIIRFGEIFLKGKNRDYFESLLIRNIKHALQGINYTFSRSQGRYFVQDFDDLDEFEIKDRLSKVFGIHSFSIAEKLPTLADENFAQIRHYLAALAKDIVHTSTVKTFRVSVKRADKRIQSTSAQLAADFGGDILESAPLKVDLTHFDVEFCVDMRENGFSYVYCDSIKGAGGLPVGCSNKGLLLLSGGIDSPVAAYMMAKRGMKLAAIHFCSPPYTSDRAKDKVIELRDIASKYATNIKLYIVPFTQIQLEIHRLCPAEFMITIMRRFMMRIASIVAKTAGCSCIITGESLGQVASQTVESMTSTQDCATLPIFRPLIAYDKGETVEIAKKIGTYEVSIQPFEDCCTIFLPKNPAIKPKLDTVRKAESALDIDTLVQQAIDGIEIV